MKQNIQEKIAQELGFVADNYYSAKENMIRQCTSSTLCLVSKESLQKIVQFEQEDLINRFCDW